MSTSTGISDTKSRSAHNQESVSNSAESFQPSSTSSRADPTSVGKKAFSDAPTREREVHERSNPNPLVSRDDPVVEDVRAHATAQRASSIKNQPSQEECAKACQHARNIYLSAKKTQANFPLHAAARKGNADLVSQLLSSKSEIDAVDTVGRTSLSHACWGGQSATANQLVMRKASVDLPDQTTRMTPLMTAARFGNADLVEVLLNGHADVSIRDNKKETALTKVLVFAEGDKERVTTILSEAEQMWPTPWTSESKQHQTC